MFHPPSNTARGANVEEAQWLCCAAVLQHVLSLPHPCIWWGAGSSSQPLLQKCPTLWNTAVPREGGQGRALSNGASWGQLARKVSMPLRVHKPLSSSRQEYSCERTGAPEQSSVPAVCPGAGHAATCNCPSPNHSPRAGSSQEAARCVWLQVPVPHAHHTVVEPLFIPHPRASTNWLHSNHWDFLLRKMSAYRLSHWLGRGALILCIQ